MKTALLAFWISVSAAACEAAQLVASGSVPDPVEVPAPAQRETKRVSSVLEAQSDAESASKPPSKPLPLKSGTELPPLKLSAALIPKPPSKVSQPPLPVEICRAGLALSKSRNLGEVKAQEDRGGVFAVSFVPWQGAPADARLFKCKLVGNSVILGQARGAHVKWSSERISWELDPTRQELTLRVTYIATGTTRPWVLLFSALHQECNGCDGYRSAVPVTEKSPTEKPKRQIQKRGGAQA